MVRQCEARRGISTITKKKVIVPGVVRFYLDKSKHPNLVKYDWEEVRVPYGDAVVLISYERSDRDVSGVKWTASGVPCNLLKVFWQNKYLWTTVNNGACNKWFLPYKTWEKSVHVGKYEQFKKTGQMDELWRKCGLANRISAEKL